MTSRTKILDDEDNVISVRVEFCEDGECNSVEARDESDNIVELTEAQLVEAQDAAWEELCTTTDSYDDQDEDE